MSEYKPPKIGDQKSKTKKPASFEEHSDLLVIKAEADFKKYYGEDGERIILAVSKEKEQSSSNDISYKSLLIDIPRYAMHMPEWQCF